MLHDFKEFFPLFFNVVVPLMAGITFFAMAKYVYHIGPMRTLITGELTYKGAYWGFLFLGIYLASRPLQILFPHPWPLIVNNLREFCMIGIFGPSVFLAMMSLVFGADNIPRRIVRGIYGASIFLALVFVVANVFAIGGSEEIFQVGSFKAYDGLWFKNVVPEKQWLIHVLFAIRLLDPVFLVLAAGTVVLWHAMNYPPEKKVLYDNMPKKLYFLGAGCYSFALSMLAVGILFLFANIPNQWWIYYVGALLAGVLETISLSLPMKKYVQVSEHQ
jgi:hypothetical protein